MGRQDGSRCPLCGAYLITLPPVPGGAPLTAVEARLAALERAIGDLALLSHRQHAEQAMRNLRLMVRAGFLTEEKAEPELDKLQRHVRHDLGGTA